jgi:hypothetical protein
VSCIFCGHITPYNQPACLSCHEPFAGAAQRKAARDQQLQQQQTMQTVGEVAGIVGAIGLGVLAMESHQHYHPGHATPPHHAHTHGRR